MAEIDNSFAVNQRGVAIPGLDRARIGEEEEENNRTEGPENAESTQRDDPSLVPDRVSLRSGDGTNAQPGAAEQQVLREQEQTFDTPSQNVNANLNENGGGLGSAIQGQVGGNRSIRDATQNLRELQAEPEGQGPLGAVDALGGPSRPGLGEINEQIEEEARNTAPSVESRNDTPDVNESQGSAQERTVEDLTEDSQDDGRGQGLAASAPNDPTFSTPSQRVENITLEPTNLSANEVNSADQASQAELRQSRQEEERIQEDQEQQNPEAATTERGQNVDELI